MLANVERCSPRGVEQRVEQAHRRRAGLQPSGVDHGLNQAHAGIERGQPEPTRIGQGLVTQRRSGATSGTNARHAFPQRMQKFVGAGPFPPVVRRNAGLVAINLVHERGAPNPTPPDRGVHQLQPAAQPTPDHHEMRAAARVADDDQGGQRPAARAEQVIERQHHLFGGDAELIGDHLDGVDRRAIDIRSGRPRATCRS